MRETEADQYKSVLRQLRTGRKTGQRPDTTKMKTSGTVQGTELYERHGDGKGDASLQGGAGCLSVYTILQQERVRGRQDCAEEQPTRPEKPA